MEQIFTPKFQAILAEAYRIGAENLKQAQDYFYKELIKLGQKERLLNLYHCKDKATKKKVWFRPNNEQLLYIDRMTKRDNILKPRQIGFTELSIKIGVDNALFTEGSAEGMMADKKEKAVKELFQRARDTFEWFDETWGELLPVILDKDEANKIIIKNVCGESMQSSYEVSADFRGRSLTRLHCSEAARISPELLRGAADSVPENGQIIHETTPKGRGGTFYGNWTETRRCKRKNEIYVWENHFFPWFHHYPEVGTSLRVPEKFILDEQERQLRNLGASDLALIWRRYKIKENFLDNPDQFDEEYPSDDESCFLGGSSIIPRKYLKLLDKWALNPIKRGHLFVKGNWMEFKDEETGFVSIWEVPKIGEDYVIGADPSEGAGKDAAAAYVKRRSNGKYVARIWSTTIVPEEFAMLLDLLGRFYNTAYINFEINNHGWVVKDRLVNICRYPNLYHRQEIDTETTKLEKKVGFRTTRESKERIIMNCVARLREGKMHHMDADFVTEATNVERDDSGKIGAIVGEHDDLFMATCLTEEMDFSLGEYKSREEDDDEDFYQTDPITGYPIF